jgi:hypothetical protein
MKVFPESIKGVKRYLVLILFAFALGIPNNPALKGSFSGINSGVKLSVLGIYVLIFIQILSAVFLVLGVSGLVVEFFKFIRRKFFRGNNKT